MTLVDRLITFSFLQNAFRLTVFIFAMYCLAFAFYSTFLPIMFKGYLLENIAFIGLLSTRIVLQISPLSILAITILTLYVLESRNFISILVRSSISYKRFAIPFLILNAIAFISLDTTTNKVEEIVIQQMNILLEKHKSVLFFSQLQQHEKLSLDEGEVFFIGTHDPLKYITFIERKNASLLSLNSFFTATPQPSILFKDTYILTPQNDISRLDSYILTQLPFIPFSPKILKKFQRKRPFDNPLLFSILDKRFLIFSVIFTLFFILIAPFINHNYSDDNLKKMTLLTAFILAICEGIAFAIRNA